MPKELFIYMLCLFAFIFLNVLIYFLIQLKAKEKVFRKLFLYWLSVLIVFCIEGTVTSGKLALSLIFIANFIPIAFMSHLLFEMFDHNFNVRLYLKAIPFAIVLTFILNFVNAPFYMVSMPIVLLNTAPLFEGLYLSLILSRKKERQIEKIIATSLYIIGILSSFYYAFFRYNATEIHYIIGFGSAFATYLLCSMLLPILCIQTINHRRTDYLETLVKDRTKELSDSKLEKEKLLRVLVHDISNPLQAVMYQVSQIKKSLSKTEKDIETIDKINKNIASIKDIISHVKEYECVLSGKRTFNLDEVYLQECLEEIKFLFEDRYAAKNVILTFHNKLSLDTKIKVDKTSFVHSVASNLVSNALKFSKPGSEVLIVAEEKNSQIVIEVIDQGIGMSKENLQNLFDIEVSMSRNGTLGETGTGFGMPIVKAYTSMFGGRVEANSWMDEAESGTTISLYLPNVINQRSEMQTFIQ